MQHEDDTSIPLPPELLEIVIYYAAGHFSTLLNMSLTCKHLNTFIHDSTNCEHTWKQAFITQFPKEYDKIINKRFWRFGLGNKTISFDRWDSTMKRLCRLMCNDKAKDRISAEYIKEQNVIRQELSQLESPSFNTINILLLGDGGVGKSTTSVLLGYGYVVDEYDPTIEDEFPIYVMDNVTKQPFRLAILDTAGQSEYSAMRDSMIHRADCYIIMYSLEYQYSFDVMECLIKSIECTRHKPIDQIPLVIVGNKKDRQEERQVGPDDIERFATSQKLSNSPYFSHTEISAMFQDNVDEMVQQIISVTTRYYAATSFDPEIRNQYNPPKKRRKRKCTLQ
jgi:GTPase KRas protein